MIKNVEGKGSVGSFFFSVKVLRYNMVPRFMQSVGVIGPSNKTFPKVVFVFYKSLTCYLEMSCLQ